MSIPKQKLSFSKQDRLCSKTQIEDIFAKGKKLKTYPFIVTYLTLKQEESDWKSPAKIVISVPKRRVKLAVKRNKLKRQIREAYRLNKCDFYQNLSNKSTNMALFLVYIGKEKEDYLFLEKKIKLLLANIQDNI